MKPICVLFLAWLLGVSCVVGSHARMLHQAPVAESSGEMPGAPMAEPAAVTATDTAPGNPTAEAPAPEKFKLPAQTVEAFQKYSSNCECGRRPKVETIQYEVSIPSKVLPNGLLSPGGRQTVTAEPDGGGDAICYGLSGALCMSKNVKCGRTNKFTDDTGKVIATANYCANSIDYL